MSDKRTLGAAMELSPEKLAFINGGANAQSQATAKVKDAIALEVPLKPEEVGEETSLRQGRRSSRRSIGGAPEPGEVLDQVLVPVTVRLPHRMAHALRRAYLEQKLKHAKPNTIQDIGKEAFADWLSRNGYID